MGPLPGVLCIWLAADDDCLRCCGHRRHQHRRRHSHRYRRCYCQRRYQVTIAVADAADSCISFDSALVSGDMSAPRLPFIAPKRRPGSVCAFSQVWFVCNVAGLRVESKIIRSIGDVERNDGELSASLTLIMVILCTQIHLTADLGP